MSTPSPPKGCANWFDGCNNCMVEKNGQLICTEMACLEPSKKTPFCKSYTDGTTCTGPGVCTPKQGCVSWFDGCNTCSVGKDGQLSGCTKLNCFVQGAPYCKLFSDGTKCTSLDECGPLASDACENKDCGDVCGSGDRMKNGVDNSFGPAVMYYCNGAKQCTTDAKPDCGGEPFNCNTREVWSDKKKEWCCENKNIGCATGLNWSYVLLSMHMGFRSLCI